MKAARFLLLSLFASALPTLAQPDLSAVDLRPLLRIHGTNAFTEDLVPPALHFFEELDILITRGGGVVSLQTQSINGGPPRQTIARGIATPELMAQLRAELTSSQAGKQSDCEVDSQGLSRASFALTWYGRGSRRNRFDVEYDTPSSSALPPCPPAVDELIGFLFLFDDSVRGNPKSEVLASD